ncbi:alpha-ketoglutarate-dependent dioxygenase AlkB family protein [Vibrio breoganii]|uniref:alpha-ketoglutarate-dependent dioxygenase AlkB family protein n=1 Tax=Vibrio breoganii TaxID=553239 RepID=UPI000C857126|nr:alpha-ketoglutarate-dependent dioxygenase AlkB [Vibrio breoganii]PMH14245.1 DNA repair protein [Vibrio breoganii]PMM13224.1 DNA repair protein [Vibrio breoganii]TKG31621.1 alpha-ketoglutarate-dependent dioxygenase AlkB [Vibrio breoganii]
MLFPEQPQWLEVEQGRLYYDPKFMLTNEANELFQSLHNQLPWEQRAIKMYGRSVMQPRLHVLCGTHAYRYSGITLEPLPWPALIQPIKQRVESIAQQSFNTALINLYRDGQDHMGWHSDDEKSLGTAPIIASLSLGASRRFILKHKQTKQKIEYILEDGALLVMAGDLQAHWQHCIPKTTKVSQPRINLTFRSVIG